MKVINVNDIDNLLGKINLIDIREPYECAVKKLEHSNNIPMETLLTNPDKFLNKEDTYYIICQSGARSQMACTYLSKLNYKVVNVSGVTGAYVGTRVSA